MGSVGNSMTPRISRSKASSTDLKNKSIDSGMTPGSSYIVTEKNFGGSRVGKDNKNLKQCAENLSKKLVGSPYLSKSQKYTQMKYKNQRIRVDADLANR
jgi:hypothetical protein